MKSRLKWFTGLSVVALVGFGAFGISELTAQPNNDEIQAETGTNVEQKIEITEENGVRTMKVTTTEDGVTTVETFTGDEIEEWLESNGHNVFINETGNGDNEEVEIIIDGNFEGEGGQQNTFHFELDDDFMSKIQELKELENLEGLSEEEVRAKVEEMLGEFGEMGQMVINVETDGDNHFEWTSGEDGDGVRGETKVIVINSDEEMTDEKMEEMLKDMKIDCQIKCEGGKGDVRKEVIITKKVTINEEGEEMPENGAFSSFNLYPNPSDGQFDVAFETESKDRVNVTVTDLSGKEVYNETFKGGNQKFELDLSDQAAGTYLLNLRQGDELMSKQLIITK